MNFSSFRKVSLVLVVIVAILAGTFYQLTNKPDRLINNLSYLLSEEDWLASLNNTKFDFIIVGSGSAGSVLANRLSSNRTGFNVLLLEAGGPDTMLEIALPAGFMKLFRTDYDWNFSTVPQKNVKNRELYWPRGKTLGGSSSMNAMIYQRGNRADYDSWSQEVSKEGQINKITNKPHWSYDDLLYYFKKSERQQDKSLDKEYHGFNGEWYISTNQWVHRLTKDFVQAFSKALNLPINHDTNGKEQIGVGFNQVNIHHGRRHSAADAFLSNSVLARPNLHVRTRALVTKVLFAEDDPKRAIGVEYVDTRSNKTLQVFADKEVILSAGSVLSAQILMLSGIGPKKELEKLNIPFRADLPVGQNLIDHFTCGLYVNVSVPSLHADEGLKSLFNWLLFGKGPFASNGAELNGFFLSETAKKLGETLPDIQIVGMPAFYVNHGFERQPYKEGYSLGTVLLAPKSRGYVTLKSANPFDKPIIQPNYLQEETDLKRILDAVRAYRKALKVEPVKNYIISEILPGASAQTDEEIANVMLDHCFTLYHPVGTCKMGPSDQASTVVSPKLKVLGIKGLRVVDASVMPNIPRGNTNAPSIMIGEKGADLILEEYGKLKT